VFGEVADAERDARVLNWLQSYLVVMRSTTCTCTALLDMQFTCQLPAWNCKPLQQHTTPSSSASLLHLLVLDGCSSHDHLPVHTQDHRNQIGVGSCAMQLKPAKCMQKRAGTKFKTLCTASAFAPVLDPCWVFAAIASPQVCRIFAVAALVVDDLWVHTAMAAQVTTTASGWHAATLTCVQ
jgi:hypothetical protein